MGRRILVVAAHADDEVLGVAGTIARHVAAGDRVGVAFLTDGVSSRAGSVSASRERQSAATRVSEELGYEIVQWGAFPDNAMDSVPLLDIVRWIESAGREWRPEVVYTNFHGDLNIDHAITCRATLTAFRPEPGQGVTEILGFEVLSSTEWAVSEPFKPDSFVDVGDVLDTITRAYGQYAPEHRPDPHARSPEALVLRRRSWGRTVGMEAAEPFITYRRLTRAQTSEGDAS